MEEKKKYRDSNTQIKYTTISLTLDQRLISEIAIRVQSIPGHNTSAFIENRVTAILKNSKNKIKKKRTYKSYPIKKTFTFTQSFVERIKLSGNMSQLVESILAKDFNLNLS
jgi:hypothetical protein